MYHLTLSLCVVCQGWQTSGAQEMSVTVVKSKCFWSFQLLQVMLEISQGLKMVQFKVLGNRTNT